MPHVSARRLGAQGCVLALFKWACQQPADSAVAARALLTAMLSMDRLSLGTLSLFFFVSCSGCVKASCTADSPTPTRCPVDVYLSGRRRGSFLGSRSAEKLACGLWVKGPDNRRPTPLFNCRSRPFEPTPIEQQATPLWERQCSGARSTSGGRQRARAQPMVTRILHHCRRLAKKRLRPKINSARALRGHLLQAHLKRSCLVKGLRRPFIRQTSKVRQVSNNEQVGLALGCHLVCCSCGCWLGFRCTAGLGPQRS